VRKLCRAARGPDAEATAKKAALAATVAAAMATLSPEEKRRAAAAAAEAAKAGRSLTFAQFDGPFLDALGVGEGARSGAARAHTHGRRMNATTCMPRAPPRQFVASLSSSAPVLPSPPRLCPLP
jgi:hypothetical protein